MKQIILIGDSISNGYFDVVAHQLREEAIVWMPDGGGRTTQHTRAHIAEWLCGRQPDIIHINCGLHDLARNFDAPEPAVPLPRYRTNLEAIFRHLKEKTAAHIIWALTTPVNEQWHHKNKRFDRLEADVCSYNDVARQVACAMQVPVNDLYAALMKAGRDSHLKEDGAHFRPEGYELLGTVVARSLRSVMAERDMGN